MPDRPWATLKVPFRSIVHLDGGATSQVFAVSANLVVKIPRRLENASQAEQADCEAAVESVEHEKGIYRLLSRNPHPSIVQSFLCTEDGIFLQRMGDSIGKRLRRQKLDDPAIDERLQHRWIKQLASATTWLETFDLFHGDMRPSNILLDPADHVKLCDFDCTTRRGEELPAASWPFYRVKGKSEALVAGPASEQFAMASCIYTIRTGREPLCEFPGPEIVQRLIKGAFPPTDGDPELGEIVFRAWREGYETMAQLEQAIGSALPGCQCEQGSAAMDSKTYDETLLECLQFLKEQGRAPEHAESGKESGALHQAERATLAA
ncbi:MAG: hypothetical protein M1832_005978 [Thelocarpon impressellum]|nr:MAG: hypothetical protein M1832_005978 [Thelocarpon impressellum]